MTLNEYKINATVRDTDIRSLMADERFNAILALISDLKDEQVVYTSNPTLADQPGLAAHNLGSISALLSLENQLMQVETAKQQR